MKVNHSMNTNAENKVRLLIHLHAYYEELVDVYLKRIGDADKKLDIYYSDCSLLSLY